MHTRRDALQLALCAIAAATACRRTSGPALPPGAITVPLVDLPEGVHVRRMRDEEPVDLLREGDVVIARSLFCTHMGCVTSWDPAANGFKCPCHGGAYDQAGAPIAGPPVAPLRRLPVAREGALVIIERLVRRSG